ncbi:unnamed protein product [Arctia plantaginis]|uniref:Uncharacterized protein n=1 Tax=Arctia plantaginis TaxID=874455 RepID=A0A8S0YNX3_ARCPL|nr:unnamed protein product [Arctia plantaginis]
MANYRLASFEAFPIIILATFIDFVTSNNTVIEDEIPKEQLDPDHENFNFKEYLSKYSPSKAWEEIDKKRKQGVQMSDEEQLDIMFNALDQTDDVYNLRIGSHIPKSDVPKDGRRFGWQPPQGFNRYVFYFDKHFNRHRIYELMRQAIYQARNRMIVMQIHREQYRKSSMYKMGFLTNKADIAVKTFAKVSFRALRSCVASRTATMMRSPVSELIEFNRRQLTLWFDAQILGQLVLKNHDIAVSVITNTTLPNIKTLNEMFIE